MCCIDVYLSRLEVRTRLKLWPLQAESGPDSGIGQRRQGGRGRIRGYLPGWGVWSSINTSPLISGNLWGRMRTLHGIAVHLLRGCDAVHLFIPYLP